MGAGAAGVEARPPPRATPPPALAPRPRRSRQSSAMRAPRVDAPRGASTRRSSVRRSETSSAAPLGPAARARSWAATRARVSPARELARQSSNGRSSIGRAQRRRERGAHAAGRGRDERLTIVSHCRARLRSHVQCDWQSQTEKARAGSRARAQRFVTSPALSRAMAAVPAAIGGGGKVAQEGAPSRGGAGVAKRLQTELMQLMVRAPTRWVARGGGEGRARRLSAALPPLNPRDNDEACMYMRIPTRVWRAAMPACHWRGHSSPCCYGASGDFPRFGRCAASARRSADAADAVRRNAARHIYVSGSSSLDGHLCAARH